MDISDIRICVLLIEGTNCEEESYLAFKRLGAEPDKVRLKEISIGKKRLADYHAVMIPGGFSAGDYIRAGAIFAARLRSALGRELTDFVDLGHPVLGICNGFQILIETGLLPGMEGTMSDMPEAVLATNDSGKFECRPTLLKHVNGGNCIFTRRLAKDKVLLIPSAHAEGKLTFPRGEEQRYLDTLIANDQVVFRYVGPDGDYAGYPWNPNGSIHNLAGICNRRGNVLGMMPHPERVFHRHTHPDWTRSEDITNESGDGKGIFESMLDYAARKF